MPILHCISCDTQSENFISTVDSPNPVIAIWGNSDLRQIPGYLLERICRFPESVYLARVIESPYAIESHSNFCESTGDLLKR